MLIHIYWNKRSGDVLVPTVAQTEAGYWLDIEPVFQAKWQDIPSVVSAVRQAASRNGTVVPTPTRQAFPKHVVLNYTSAKSTSEFEKKFDMATIQDSVQGSYLVNRYMKAPSGSGKVVDVSMSTTHAAGTTIEEIVEGLRRTISLK